EEDGAEIETTRLPMLDSFAHLDAVHAADHLVHAPETELRHQQSNLFGHEEEVVDDILGLALEFGSKGRVLGGDSDGASIQMALAHHDAAHRHQRSGGESELFGTQQGGYHDVTPCLQLAVGL